MIIKKVQIENYLCYFDNNIFELSEGLNIILGENGEGKTKFFESIDWLFNGVNRDLEQVISAKKNKETEVGNSFRVRVSMTVEQNAEKIIITRSFVVKKESETELSTTNFILEGIIENSAGERDTVDGKALLDQIFPFEIREYSMFKGEAELNIFENEEALVNLVKLFSEAKHYEKYSKKGEFLRKKAEEAVEDSTKTDRKNEAAYNRLMAEIQKLKNEKEALITHFNLTELEISKIEANLQEVERHNTNAEALEIINKRVKEIEAKITNLAVIIDENYTTSLFDDNWILVNFEQIHNEFVNKISKHSKIRRELQTEYDKQIGIREGEKKALSELLNNSIPLPISVPSRSHMEEMLNDEICKVCNREAKKGSDAYEFMMQRLKTYLESQTLPDDVEDKIDPLFKYDYTNRLDYLCISHEDNLKNLRLIKTKIIDQFEFNKSRKLDLKELEEKLEDEFSERDKIFGRSTLGEQRLRDIFQNYKTWHADLTTKNIERGQYQFKIKELEKIIKTKVEEKDKIDTSSANSFLLKTRDLLRDIEKIFLDTKENKFDEFIHQLEAKSNNFLQLINVDSFTGEICIYKKNRPGKIAVEVELKQNGKPYYMPNESLKTSMYISILLAISELAFETKSEYYPLIFDAPTSSFGDYKTSQFLNLVSETKSQKIILTKNFLNRDSSTKKLFIEPEFEKVKRDKAFWVKLEEPYDNNDLTTINSKVITL